MKASAAPEGDDFGPLTNAVSLEVERALLSVCLDGRHRDAWATIRDRSDGVLAFFGRNHRLVALVIDHLDGAGEPVDAVTVAAAAQQVRFGDALDALRRLEGAERAVLRRDDSVGYDDSVLAHLGGYNALGDLQNAHGSSSGQVKNAETLDALHRQRRAIDALTDLYKRVQAVDGAKNLRAIADDASNRLHDIAATGRAIRSIGTGAAEALRQHDQAATCGLERLGSWGVKPLDASLRLIGGQVVILAARPGCGKTSMLLQVATATHRALGPDSVGLVSLEMNETDLARIIVARDLCVGRQAIERGWLSAEQREAFAIAIERWRRDDIPIKGHGGKGTVDEIVAWIRSLHRRSAGRLHLVGIDYLGLINGTNPKHNANERVGEITRKLKTLALDLDLCVLLLCQLNRESVKDKRAPELSDLRDSGNIEQDADAVVFLYAENDAEGDVVLVNAKVAKNRRGTRSTLGLEFHKARGQRFDEIGGDRPKRGERMRSEPNDAEDVTNNPPQQEP